MENASKALIIAGAILLAIVIISLGLVVVNNTRSVTDNANLNSQEIETFNNKFAAYEGQNVTGSRVKSLIQAIKASNGASGRTISYTITSGTGTSAATLQDYQINLSDKFNVVLTYGTDGYVSSIAISK